MIEHDFLDALDDCIDRLAAGESIDDCLSDYPEQADRLRDLLEMGELVQQAVYPDSDVVDAQSRVQMEVLEAMTYANGKRKRKNRETDLRHERIVMLVAAAATIVIVAGIALMTLIKTEDGVTTIALGNTDAAQLAANQTATDIACQTLTAVPEIVMAGTSQPGTMLTMTVPPLAIEDITHSPTVTPLPTTTAMPSSEPGYVATSVAGMEGVSPTSEGWSGVALTATAITDGLLASPPAATPEPGMMMPTATPASLAETGGDGYGRTDGPSMLYFMPPENPHGPVAGIVTFGDREALDPAIALTVSVGDLDDIIVLSSATPIPMGTSAPMGTPVAFSPTATPAPMVEMPEIMPLSAGEIDDNADWDTYLLYRQNYLRQYAYSVVDVDVTGRQIIRVVDSDGLPVIGAQVRVYLREELVSESCTYADGRTLFFPYIGLGQVTFEVVVEKDNISTEFTLDPSAGFVWDVVLDGAEITRDQVQLDVLFLLDSTGSMGDEISQLQNNILHISSEVDALGGVDVRYGLVTYRDRGDAYITRNFGFMIDVGAFQGNLNNISADGGGDTPESVNEALHVAIHDVDWRGGNTVQLIFLVADARPHLDYAQDYDYAEEMVIAAQNGIKIHPLASSGLEPAGEFIFRQIAQYTMGHFIFLTYDDSVPGTTGAERDELSVGDPDDPDDPQDEGDYTVEQLDELVLRLITDELAALRGGEMVSVPQPLDVTVSENLPCTIERRIAPEGAPTLVPSSNDEETRTVDPHVAVCLSDETIQVGETFRLYVQAIDIGMPIYGLTLTGENGENLSVRVNPALGGQSLEVEGVLSSLELMSIEQINSWNVAFVFRALGSGHITGDVYASGEIHYGYPGPATWAGGSSDGFSFDIIGR
jgi:hypothetical protein